MGHTHISHNVDCTVDWDLGLSLDPWPGPGNFAGGGCCHTPMLHMHTCMHTTLHGPRATLAARRVSRHAAQQWSAQQCARPTVAAGANQGHGTGTVHTYISTCQGACTTCSCPCVHARTVGGVHMRTCLCMYGWGCTCTHGCACACMCTWGGLVSRRRLFFPQPQWPHHRSPCSHSARPYLLTYLLTYLLFPPLSLNGLITEVLALIARGLLIKELNGERPTCRLSPKGGSACKPER